MYIPNGEHAIGTIAVSEGRARRIADYRKLGTNQKAYPRESAKKHAPIKSQMAEMRHGVARRDWMANYGRMIHGSGGNAAKHPKRVKSDNTVSGHWSTYKAPSGYAVKKSHKNALALKGTGAGPKKGKKGGGKSKNKP